MDTGGARKGIRPQLLLCSKYNLVPRTAQSHSLIQCCSQGIDTSNGREFTSEQCTHCFRRALGMIHLFHSEYTSGPHTKAQLHNRHLIIYSSCPWKPAPCGWEQLKTWNDNPHVLEGALVGGPGELSGNFIDDRQRFEFTEVATDYNSGFVGAVAGLCSVCNRKPLRLRRSLHTYTKE